MTVTTIFATSNDGDIRSDDAVYLTARAGSAFTVTIADFAALHVGQAFDAALYSVWEAFTSFDTSAIPDTDVVSAVVLSLYGANSNDVTPDFTIEARTKDWGATLTSADWVAGADIAALTLLATFATTGWTSAYMAFAENGANFVNAINKTGTTYVLLDSSRVVNGDVPTGAGEGSSVLFWDAGFSGTSQDPKLTITHAPLVTSVVQDPIGMGVIPFAR